MSDLAGQSSPNLVTVHALIPHPSNPPPPNPHSPTDPEAYLIRLLDCLDSGPYPVASFLTLWCGGRRLADVRWGNVRGFLSWALFARHEADLTAPERAALDRMVRGPVGFDYGPTGSVVVALLSYHPHPNFTPQLKHTNQDATVRRRYGPRLQMEEGTNDKLTPMAMTLQPLEWHHRPLLVYLFITVIPHAALHLFLRAVVGLRRQRTPGDGHPYWYRPGHSGGGKSPTGGSESAGGGARLPLLFFHGVGGLGLYAPLVWRLARERAGPIVLVEIPHVGLTLQDFEAKGPVR